MKNVSCTFTSEIPKLSFSASKLSESSLSIYTITLILNCKKEGVDDINDIFKSIITESTTQKVSMSLFPIVTGDDDILIESSQQNSQQNSQQSFSQPQASFSQQNSQKVSVSMSINVGLDEEIPFKEISVEKDVLKTIDVEKPIVKDSVKNIDVIQQNPVSKKFQAPKQKPSLARSFHIEDSTDDSKSDDVDLNIDNKGIDSKKVTETRNEKTDLEDIKNELSKNKKVDKKVLDDKKGKSLVVSKDQVEESAKENKKTLAKSKKDVSDESEAEPSKKTTAKGFKAVAKPKDEFAKDVSDVSDVEKSAAKIDTKTTTARGSKAVAKSKKDVSDESEAEPSKKNTAKGSKAVAKSKDEFANDVSDVSDVEKSAAKKDTKTTTVKGSKAVAKSKKDVSDESEAEPSKKSTAKRSKAVAKSKKYISDESEAEPTKKTTKTTKGSKATAKSKNESTKDASEVSDFETEEPKKTTAKSKKTNKFASKSKSDNESEVSDYISTKKPTAKKGSKIAKEKGVFELPGLAESLAASRSSKAKPPAKSNAGKKNVNVTKPKSTRKTKAAAKAKDFETEADAFDELDVSSVGSIEPGNITLMSEKDLPEVLIPDMQTIHVQKVASPEKDIQYSQLFATNPDVYPDLSPIQQQPSPSMSFHDDGFEMENEIEKPAIVNVSNFIGKRDKAGSKVELPIVKKNEETKKKDFVKVSKKSSSEEEEESAKEESVKEAPRKRGRPARKGKKTDAEDSDKEPVVRKLDDLPQEKLDDIDTSKYLDAKPIKKISDDRRETRALPIVEKRKLESKAAISESLVSKRTSKKRVVDGEILKSDLIKGRNQKLLTETDKTSKSLLPYADLDSKQTRLTSSKSKFFENDFSKNTSTRKSLVQEISDAEKELQIKDLLRKVKELEDEKVQKPDMFKKPLLHPRKRSRETLDSDIDFLNQTTILGESDEEESFVKSISQAISKRRQGDSNLNAKTSLFSESSVKNAAKTSLFGEKEVTDRHFSGFKQIREESIFKLI